MKRVIFLDDKFINVVARDGEIFNLKSHLPVIIEDQQTIGKYLIYYFDENFSDDKTSMVYWVLMKMMDNVGFSFSYVSTDKSEARERIGAKIKQLREDKGIEAKQFAVMSNIDAANLSRIEKGKYSVGLDILTKISHVLGVKVDLV